MEKIEKDVKRKMDEIKIKIKLEQEMKKYIQQEILKKLGEFANEEVGMIHLNEEFFI